MIFLGLSLFGDESCVNPTATYLEKMTYVELKHGNYDDLYISNDVSGTVNELIPDQWEFDTVLHATFEDVTDAGNVGWNLSNTTNILVKRRESGASDWTTIAEREVHTLADFNFAGIDYYARSKTDYDYAIVATLQHVEGNYNISTVHSEFDGIHIAEKDTIYGTIITDDYVDTVRNIPSSVTALPNMRYPKYISNSVANYDTGSCSGTFVYFNQETCDFDFDHIANQTYFVMDVLANRKPKILKIGDGRMWLIMVTGNPTDSGKDHLYNRVINFEWAEIGDYNSEKDMYYANLLDIDPKWWSA